MTILPNYANAFWPFSTNANAAVNTTFAGSRPPVLAAAINSDPNPNKGYGSLPTSGNAILSYNGPGGTIAEIANDTPPDRISVYVVRGRSENYTGDTLSEIATMFHVTMDTIVWANNLSSRDAVLHDGDMLIILPVSGIERTVVKGDTLKSLAKKYGGDANEIAQYNGLDPAALLKVGSIIIIPGGEIAAPVPRARSSSAPREPEPYLGGSGPILTGYFSNPVPGGVITQGLHGWNGIDIGAARGTPIHAAAKGTVIVVRNNGAWNGGYGNYVVIKHTDDNDIQTQTLYSHMKSAIVSAGQEVLKGQIIGYVGATGHASGPHLHFEVRGAANPLRNCRVGSVCSPQ
ncbi:MAG: LysM peptidoglycan-binding domain-containing M23 family metallopeptidase [bacterium]|nr:LysM peptidoglycan-binding domain-containing M23 family metallopeptidase [bacterium]